MFAIIPASVPANVYLVIYLKIIIIFCLYATNSRKLCFINLGIIFYIWT